MNKNYDVYTWFWDNEKDKLCWNSVRDRNTYLFFRQKLCILLKNGKEQFSKIIFSKEYRKENGGKIYLKDELESLYNILENIANQNLEKIPKYSCLIKITFKLKKAYVSKDDETFYPCNPIVKDKVFKIPMVRPSTWKGTLRYSAIKVFEEEFDENTWKEKRLIMIRLFGNEKEVIENYLNSFISSKTNKKYEEIKEEFRNFLSDKGYINNDIDSKMGRVILYPTFFNEISLDVITPLDRRTRTPVKNKAPIYFELVPKGTVGKFKLLYYPFDLISKGEFDKIEKESKEDLEFLTKALNKMFFEIGFSAKKSSGFGVIEPLTTKDIEIKHNNLNLDTKTLLKFLCS